VQPRAGHHRRRPDLRAPTAFRSGKHCASTTGPRAGRNGHRRRPDPARPPGAGRGAPRSDPDRLGTCGRAAPTRSRGAAKRWRRRRVDVGRGLATTTADRGAPGPPALRQRRRTTRGRWCGSRRAGCCAIREEADDGLGSSTIAADAVARASTRALPRRRCASSSKLRRGRPAEADEYRRRAAWPSRA
jgi:hypothetical protein